MVYDDILEFIDILKLTLEPLHLQELVMNDNYDETEEDNSDSSFELDENYKWDPSDYLTENSAEYRNYLLEKTLAKKN